MARWDPTRRRHAPSARQNPDDRAARKLIDRLAVAEGNVTVAVDDANARGRLGDQLWHAVAQWRAEATQVRQEVVTASRLAGDARQAALKPLRRRVSAIEEVAERIVESAFTDRLTPDDQLQEATERLDALDQAHDELDGIDLPTGVRRVWLRLTSIRPGSPKPSGDSPGPTRPK